MLKLSSKTLSILLFPFSVLYTIIIIIRNRLYDFNFLPVKEFDIPVISVGNITVGGTGKTPHIEFLIRLLKNEFCVATLSRGYKRKTRGFILATPQSTVFEIGDEPKQIKEKFNDIYVAVDANRVRGIKILLSSALDRNPDVILLDDAYQYRAIKPGISILLIDYNRIIFNDCMLPSGRLREPIEEKRRANIIIITRTPLNIKPIERRIIEKHLNLFPYQKLYFTYIKYWNILPVFNHQLPIFDENKFDRSVSVLLVTGIANTLSITKYLNEKNIQFTHLKFPDHHNYNQKDIKRISDAFMKISSTNKILLTTEKDAMRFKNYNSLDSIITDNLYYIPIEIDFLYDETTTFTNTILDYVRKNSTHNRLYKKQS